MVIPDCKHGEAVEVRNGLTRFSRNGTRPQAKENRFHATASRDGSWLSKANVQTAVDHSNTRSTVTYQTSAFSCDRMLSTICLTLSTADRPISTNEPEAVIRKNDACCARQHAVSDLEESTLLG